MSNKALSYIFEHSETKGSARVLMLTIADMANDDGECYPGKAKLAAKVNVSERQLTTLIRDCEALGELRVFQRSHSAEDHRTNKYYIVGMYDEKRETKIRTPKPRTRRKVDKKAADRFRQLAKDSGTPLPVSETGHKNTASGGHENTASTKPSHIPLTSKRVAPAKADAAPLDLTPEELFNDAIARAAHLPTPPASSNAVAKVLALPANGKKPGRPNPHFDAIVEAFGVDPDTLTKTENGGIGKVANELKAAGYTPEDIGQIHAYCIRQNFASFTWHALTAHASKWRATQNGTGRAHSPSGLDVFEVLS